MNKFYLANPQANTLANALKEEMGFTEATANTYASRGTFGATVQVDLSGTWTDPVTGIRHEITVTGVRLVRTPDKWLKREAV